MNLKTVLLAGAISSCALIAGNDAFADADNSGSAGSGNSGIETVLVTARHRTKSAQDVPVSVTAVDAAEIEKLFVHDLTDLNYQAPNLTIQGVGAIDRNAAVIYARGIGYSNVDQGQDPAVGVSVNGVFSARNIGQLSNMLDVESVQILTGPQGTLTARIPSAAWSISRRNCRATSTTPKSVHATAISDARTILVP